MKAVEHDKLAAKLRKEYPTVQALRNAGWWLQRKYDGVFGMAVIRPAREDCAMLTRTGEPVRSCEHLLDALHQAAVRFNTDETVVVLGELWAPRMPFPEISGLARRHAPSPQLYFIANDVLPEGLETSLNYHARFKHLERLVLRAPGQVVMAFTIKHNERHPNEPPVTTIAAQWVAAGGFDGAILRDSRAPYTIGLARQGQIVKVKPTLSLDLRVVELTEAVGERTGRAVYTIGVSYRGVVTQVGSGMPHNAADLPKVGQIVEVECIGVTEDGKLREPRYKGIRFDKEQPDT